MAEGLTDNLQVVAGLCFLAGFVIVNRDLNFPAAVAVSAIKIGLPTIYFAWYFDGSWTLLDDRTYLQIGEYILRRFPFPEAYLNGDALDYLSTVSGGTHFLYYAWNVLAQWLIGPYYYAPVFLNVLTTFVSGYFLYRIILIAEFGKTYARGALIFFLLHWDILAWSSLLNLKGSLVIMLTVIMVYAVLNVFKGFRWRWLALLAGVAFILLWIRFYVPVLMMGATGIWLILKTTGRGRMLLLLLAFAGFWVLFPSFVYLEELLSPLQMPAGLVLFALRPRPWSLDPNYTFLLIPTILHYILFVPALIGAVLLWNRSPEAVLVLLYAASIWFVFSMFPEQQGVRHRYQIVFVTAWAQYHFLWSLLQEGVRGVQSLRQPRPNRRST